jgi:putative ubiquitin-RnfH superfamily antitoxin RatB of RatAB toxin-antitoxin module
MINVEVAYALPHEQKIIALPVEEGCTAYQAAVRSGIAEQFPEIDLATTKMGIFGKVLKDPAATTLQEGDRVEIYRPLIADPKEVRARRAAKMKAEKGAKPG